MINFDSLCLKYLNIEFHSVFQSGRIQKIQQPSRKELLINIRSLGKNICLYINIDPKYPHLCVLNKQGEKLRDIKNPLKPPMFCMLLRKYIEGAKIKDVKVPAHERIFEIYIDSYNELGDVEELVLSVELMGKYSNIILYKSSDKTIIGCAHNIGSEKSRVRELAGGLPYIYPEVQNKKDICKVSQEEFYNDMKLLHQPIFWELNQVYFDISIPLAKELCKSVGIENDFEKISAIETQKIMNLYNQIKKVLCSTKTNPSITGDKNSYSLFSLDIEDISKQFDTVNDMLNEYFGYFIYEDNFNKIKNRIKNVVKKNIKHLEKEIKNLTPSEEDELKSVKYKQTGDILAANLYMLKDGQNQVQLENFYENNQKITITLDPTKTINENIQRYYKLHSKAKTALSINAQRKQQMEEELNYFYEILISTEQADKISTLYEIKEELISQNLLDDDSQKNHKQKNKELPNIDSIEYQGYIIYIGKNHKQNDYIISKLAHNRDIWMHAHNMPGSHVLIKLPPQDETVPDSVLFKGAQLAAYYSSGRNSTKKEIIYTSRKFLKKPPGAKPGYVTYSGEKTIIVD